MHFSCDSSLQVSPVKPVLRPFIGISSALDQNANRVLSSQWAIRRGEAHGCFGLVTPRKLRLSALASSAASSCAVLIRYTLYQCVALPAESIQSSGRHILAVIKNLLFLEMPLALLIQSVNRFTRHFTRPLHIWF